MNIKIITFERQLRENVIEFIKSVAIDEYQFYEWNDYLDNKDFSSYERGESLFLVAIDQDEKIIGTCGGLKVGDEVIKLNSFYVNKHFRNRGIGRELFDRIVKFAKENGFKRMILCTYERFERSKVFYQKRGFKLYKVEGIENWCEKDLTK